ncbi:MAG: hypothetical protein ACRENP_26585, partial [Longimicrobiales bacterium]
MRSSSILPFAVSGVTVLALACTDPATTLHEPPPADSTFASGVTVAGLIISEPARRVITDSSESVNSVEDEFTYVSLRPGSLPNALSVQLRNLTAG